jgi:predicted MPP superfamily phosphohydrolase
MAQRPDVIVLTGDLVDGSVEALAQHVAPLGQLRARYGVYFITGNHEYYSGVDAWLAHLMTLGIRPLRNERVTLGEGPMALELAGIDDWTASHFGGGHGADLPRALAGRDTNRELILLAHQPKAVHEAAEHGVGLMLSGHTHGGQIFPFGVLVRLAQPFVRGLHSVGETQIYVNRGTGYWGPPMRLGSAPEITLVTLQGPGRGA